MLEKPKPLNLAPAAEPRSILKSMLEARRGETYQESVNPISSLNPMTLDTLIDRIDTGALALGLVPDPKDISQLVAIYWSMQDKFNLEQAQEKEREREKGGRGRKTTNHVQAPIKLLPEAFEE